MNEVIREFLIETNENLSQLDLDLVTLEKSPTERETLGRVFRTMHTVKGTAGFLGFQKLQDVAHAAETLLSRLREGELIFNSEIASALLSVADAVREMLGHVEKSQGDGDGDYSTVIQTLERLLVSASGRVPIDPVPLDELVALSPGSGKIGPPTSERHTVTFATPESPVPDVARGQAAGVAESTIRVDVQLLDKLMTLVGEMVLARNQIMQLSISQEDTALLGCVQRLNLLTGDLQAGVMKTRMQPVSNIWSKFPRVVRDLAAACGKQARIEMDGQETELDRTIIEAIRDPLTHLVRNAVDHGIETAADRLERGKPVEGRLTLHAFQEGGKVIIEISDDGAGIDPQRVRAKAIQTQVVTRERADAMTDHELINLIFLPGFSTSDSVTQFSGRGVGMDVVRTNIEKIGGVVSVESRLGQGSTIKMKVPLTLAIIPALIITSDGNRYAIPQVNLLELVRLDKEQVERGVELIHDAPVYRLRDHLLPIVFLRQQLQTKKMSASIGDGEMNIVVLQADDRQFGLVVDAIHDTEEIVVKPLQKQINGINIFAGATIRGDGRVALILDVAGLAYRANVISGVRERTKGKKSTNTPDPAADRQNVLLIATDDGGRMALPLSSVARLEEFSRSAVERVGLQDVVQYRNEILPLIHISRILGRRRPRISRFDSRPSPHRNVAQPESDAISVVVLAGEGQRVGLVVDRILDIVEETIASRSTAHRSGALFTAVIQGRVTEFLDVESIFRSVDLPFHSITVEL